MQTRAELKGEIIWNLNSFSYSEETLLKILKLIKKD